VYHGLCLEHCIYFFTSITAISKIHGTLENFVFLIFRKYGCVEDLSHLRGRSRILSVEDTKYLANLLKEKIDWYLWEKKYYD
jgi:hypothetical protein